MPLCIRPNWEKIFFSANLLFQTLTGRGMAHYKNKRPNRRKGLYNPNCNEKYDMDRKEDENRMSDEDGRRKRKKTKEGKLIWRMEADQLAKIEEDYQESNLGAEEKGEAK